MDKILTVLLEYYVLIQFYKNQKTFFFSPNERVKTVQIDAEPESKPPLWRGFGPLCDTNFKDKRYSIAIC